jgi:hypothetical protein
MVEKALGCFTFKRIDKCNITKERAKEAIILTHYYSSENMMHILYT